MGRTPPAALAAASLLLMLGGCGALADDAPDDPPRGDATAPADEPLLWSDEFDGPAGVRPAAEWWTTDLGNREWSGWGNDELQSYTADTANSALDGAGNLVIQALPSDPSADLPCFTRDRCPYTSARITTAGTVGLREGRVEVRALLPTGRGLLPAIWMLGDGVDGAPAEAWPARGEIDIAEVVGGEPSTVYGTVHGPGYSGVDGLSGTTGIGAPASDGFHVFAVDKRADRIAWSIDGREYFDVTRDDIPAGSTWAFERDMHVLLNVAVGGRWPGDPDASTVFPARMLVDYVRVYGTGTVL
ncbi:family 16 glycosylhydrolase [Schumannella sp. 10F1B-5-1]|uniref:glycoside hydrolase family 16 protein n=1 Tax=Schumannella sp. 10F1B-5-1 TaxID=2590780 RepID=UPI001131A3FF|nr:glycoside hydrolase family 16 protein [Schumannella sp. 10F1B-5-1]TPW73606.1 glycoside hydrolase family 16 protein [Schumannella sp. 10F1B-5-1]